MKEEEFKALLKNNTFQVFLFTCPATFPYAFARHPWFVVNDTNAVSRWEVFWQPDQSWPLRWGHLHKDFFSPAQGIEMFFGSEQHFFASTLHGCIEGSTNSPAARMAACIHSSPEHYPFCHQYSLSGPNSNTYVQWVLDQFPESKLRLPWNSFGKHSTANTSRV